MFRHLVSPGGRCQTGWPETRRILKHGRPISLSDAAVWIAFRSPRGFGLWVPGRVRVPHVSRPRTFHYARESSMVRIAWFQNARTGHVSSVFYTQPAGVSSGVSWRGYAAVLGLLVRWVDSHKVGGTARFMAESERGGSWRAG